MSEQLLTTPHFPWCFCDHMSSSLWNCKIQIKSMFKHSINSISAWLWRKRRNSLWHLFCHKRIIGICLFIFLLLSFHFLLHFYFFVFLSCLYLTFCIARLRKSIVPIGTHFCFLLALLSFSWILCFEKYYRPCCSADWFLWPTNGWRRTGSWRTSPISCVSNTLDGRSPYFIFSFSDLSILDSLMSMVTPGNNMRSDRSLFYCPKCLHGFTLKSNRNRHYKYECGHKPRFQCPYCELKSKQTSQIYCHIRKKHPNERVCVIDLKF